MDKQEYFERLIESRESRKHNTLRVSCFSRMLQVIILVGIPLCILLASIHTGSAHLYHSEHLTQRSSAMNNVFTNQIDGCEYDVPYQSGPPIKIDWLKTIIVGWTMLFIFWEICRISIGWQRIMEDL